MNYAESYSDRIRQNQSECQKSRCTGDVPYTVGFLVDFRYLHMALRWQVEHVNAQVLEELHQKGVPVQPLPFVVKLIQDKYDQKATATEGWP